MTIPVEGTRSPKDLIAQYLRLRDQKRIADERFKEFMSENFTVKLDTIESLLMDVLNQQSAESLKTDVGTCFKRVETSVTVASMPDFQRHVIGSGQWELIDWRANKTAVKNFVETHGDKPPGVNMTQAVVLSVRKPT